MRKIRLISEFMASNCRRQTTAIHILPNTSRRKDNQALKSGQLIKYNTISIFLEKPYTICGVETMPRPFSKKSKLSIKIEHIFESIV